MGKMRKIYGMRIVPEYNKSGLLYGGFDGIVISSDTGGANLRIVKMKKNEAGGYFVDSSTPISLEKDLEYSQTSGRTKAEFLYLEARRLHGPDHKIAICDKLAGHLLLLDEAWEHFKEVLDRKRE